MAANIIRACKKMGKRVPEDISIVGFDEYLDFHTDVSFHYDHSSAGAGNV